MEAFHVADRGIEMKNGVRFLYSRAFDRNIGWLADWEQQSLRGKTVAIAGLGGVGSLHLLSLARLGIGGFHLADLDCFELPNFNRQFGATIETLDRPKVEVMAEMVRSINPQVRLRTFGSGLQADNLAEFLDGADLFVDGLDFFELPIRRQVFARCAELGIPAVTAAPLGMGASLLVFLPGRMTFEDYFRLEGFAEEEQYLRFLLGLSPRAFCRRYLVDSSRVALNDRRGPSTVIGCELSAAVTGAAAVKLLLARGDVKPAPYVYQFDAYRSRAALTHVWRGNAGPVQAARIAVARWIYGRQPTGVSAETQMPRSAVEEILDAARWSPSGDNAQPWRFQLISEDRVNISLAAQSGNDKVYEYRDGEPTVLAGGMLLESIRIAAMARQRGVAWRYEGEHAGNHRIAVHLPRLQTTEWDPLFSQLSQRSVNRWRYRMRPLTGAEKSALESALGGVLSITWYDTLRERWQWGRLGAAATNIRMRIPECHGTHNAIIDWQDRDSLTGIPSRALGLDRVSLAIMRWSLPHWRRVRLVNAAGGTVLARLEMDLVPALCSAAFFAIHLRDMPKDKSLRIDMLLRAGAAIQRFWLTAAKLGLALQPSLATLAFVHYGDTATPFTADPKMQSAAARLAQAFRSTIGTGPQGLIFAGRIGEPLAKFRRRRSVRRSMAELTTAQESDRASVPARLVG